MQYFNNCKTIEEVKALFRQLAKDNHPDRGGNLEIMQAINAEYSKAIERLANGANVEDYESTILSGELYKEAIAVLMPLAGIEIELCGEWIWVSGNTFAHKDILKNAVSATGNRLFFFASKKKQWYFRPADAISVNRKTMTMEQIRMRHGSITLTKQYSNLLN